MVILNCYSLCLLVVVGTPSLIYLCCKPTARANSRLATSKGEREEIIGRYECNEVLPSMEWLQKIADVLEISLDYMAGNSKKAAVDKKTMKLIHDIEDLEPTIKNKLIFLANAVIREAKTSKAYA